MFAIKNLLLGVLLVATLSGGAASVKDEVLFEDDFSLPNALKGWKGGSFASIAQGEGMNGKACLKITATPDAKNKSALITRELDVKKFAGRAVQMEGWMRGENIGTPLKPWLGPKLMISVRSNHEPQFLDQIKRTGTFPWEKFTVFARIPDQVTQIRLSLGLEGTVGTVYMSGVKIVAVPQVKPPQNDHTGKSIQTQTQYRGAMIGRSLEEKDFKELGAVWGANLIRFQIVRTWKGNSVSEAEYDQWLDKELERLDKTLPWARKYGLSVVIDLHSGPFMEQNALAHNRLVWSQKMNDKMVAVWEKIARRYKGVPGIYGYDLLNEPREDGYVYEGNGPLDWNRLTERVAKAIRAIDPDTPIIIEPAPWGKPIGLLSFQPIDVANVIYSVHFYTPHDITHQGVSKSEPYTGTGYPSKIKNVMWNKEQLRKMLAPAREFQLKWKVPIYVGEFGCIRWAPGDTAPKYLRDCIEIFEEFGWDWTYHAFREWDGWSVEHESEPNKPGKFVNSTPRKNVLLEYMQRNIKKKL